MRMGISCTAAKSMVRCTLVPYLSIKKSGLGTDCRGKDWREMLTSIARLFHEWKRYSEARRELSHLSDRELADIGITRSDIDRIAAGQADR